MPTITLEFTVAQATRIRNAFGKINPPLGSVEFVPATLPEVEAEIMRMIARAVHAIEEREAEAAGRATVVPL